MKRRWRPCSGPAQKARGISAPPPTVRLALERQADVPEDSPNLALLKQTRGSPEVGIDPLTGLRPELPLGGAIPSSFLPIRGRWRANARRRGSAEMGIDPHTRLRRGLPLGGALPGAVEALGGRRRKGGPRRGRGLPAEGKEWCRRAGLNCRPQPYQGCALPLSYGGERRGAGSSQSRAGREGEKRGGRRLDREGAGRHRDGVKTPPPSSPSEAERREARRAQALRANLRRRKAPAPPSASDAADPPCDSPPCDFGPPG